MSRRQWTPVNPYSYGRKLPRLFGRRAEYIFIDEAKRMHPNRPEHQSLEQAMIAMAEKLRNESRPVPPEIAKAISEDFMELI